jgi:hypothetical protein
MDLNCLKTRESVPPQKPMDPESLGYSLGYSFACQISDTRSRKIPTLTTPTTAPHSLHTSSQSLPLTFTTMRPQQSTTHFPS